MSKENYCPKILLFENGTRDNGGIILESFKKRFHSYDKTFFNGEIVGVVSSHQFGGTRRKADKLEIPFYFFQGQSKAEEYKEIIQESGAEFFIFADWLNSVQGYNLGTVFNSKTAVMVHPGPYPQFANRGFYGNDLYGYVCRLFKRGEIDNSQIICHFIMNEFSNDTILARIQVELNEKDTASTLEKKVKEIISERLPSLVNMVANGKIS